MSDLHERIHRSIEEHGPVRLDRLNTIFDTGEYLEFPYDIPIPCDLQVERVTETSGIADSTETGEVMAAWAEVMERVSQKVGHPISLLRIDSIIWQAGQVIGNAGENLTESRQALEAHFQEVGLNDPERTALATELTTSLDYHTGA